MAQFYHTFGTQYFGGLNFCKTTFFFDKTSYDPNIFWTHFFLTQLKLEIVSRYCGNIAQILCRYCQQKAYQGTLETQELTTQVSMTSLDPLLNPTESFKRTLGFSRFCQPVFTFLQNTLSKNHLNIIKYLSLWYFMDTQIYL